MKKIVARIDLDCILRKPFPLSCKEIGLPHVRYWIDTGQSRERKTQSIHAIINEEYVKFFGFKIASDGPYTVGITDEVRHKYMGGFMLKPVQSPAYLKILMEDVNEDSRVKWQDFIDQKHSYVEICHLGVRKDYTKSKNLPIIGDIILRYQPYFRYQKAISIVHQKGYIGLLNSGLKLTLLGSTLFQSREAQELLKEMVGGDENKISAFQSTYKRGYIVLLEWPDNKLSFYAEQAQLALQLMGGIRI